MTRTKVKDKNKTVSISLPKYQIKFVKENPDFNLSKFVQLYLRDYMNGN